MSFRPCFVTLAVLAALSGCGPDEPPAVTRDQASARAVGFQGLTFSAPPRSVQDVLDRLDRALRSAPAPVSPDDDEDDDGPAPADDAGAAPAMGTRNWRAIADSQPPAGASNRALASFFSLRANASQRLGRTQQMMEDTRRAASLAREAGHGDVGAMHQILALREFNYGRIDAAFAAIDDGLRSSPTVASALALHREKIVFYSQLHRRADATRALADMARVAEPAVQGSGPFVDLYRVRYDAARANVAGSHGRYREAEPLWLSVAAAARRMRDKAQAGQLPGNARRFVAPYTLEYTRALGALAFVQAQLGRVTAAEATERVALDEALRVFGPWASQSTQRLVHLGQNIMAQGRIDEAEQIFERVWRILDRNEVPASAVLRLQVDVEVANARALKRDFRGARRIYDRMAAALREQGPQADRFLHRNPLYGLTLLETQAAGAALPVLTTAFEGRAAVFGSSAGPSAVVRALRAEAQARSGHVAAAREDYTSALPSLRSPIGSPGDEDVSAKERMRRLALDYAIDFLGPRGGPEGALALAAADSFGSLGVQAAIHALATRSGAVDAATATLLRDEQDAALRIGVLERQLVDVTARRVPDAPAARQVQAELAAARQDRQRLRAEVVRRTPRLQRLERNAGLDVAKLAAVLREGEVALAIHTGPHRTHVWSVTRAGIAGYHSAAIGAAAMGEQVARLRDALDVDDSIRSLGDIRRYDVATAHRLYQALLEPVRSSWAGAQSVIAAVSGPLSALPLGVLVTATAATAMPAAGQPLFAEYRAVPFLAREVAIAHVPSLSAFVALREIREGTASRRAFLAFADPVFSAAAAAPASDGPIALRAAFRAASRSTSTVADLPPLPDTAEEARAIGAVLGASADRDLYLGARATERSLRSLDMSNWRVVMFATHGLLAGDLDGLTEPALALSRSGEPGDEGLLTVGEIMTLRLDADWVVLSACNTAGPLGTGGEALSGVSRAFLYAGARSLLVTHWPVETTAARSFTVELFKRQAVGDASRGAAMRAVTQDMILRLGSTDGAGRLVFSYAHPLFWAPFAFVGDPG